MSDKPQSGDLVSFVDKVTQRRVFGHVATPAMMGLHYRVRVSGSGYANKVALIEPFNLTVEVG